MVFKELLHSGGHVGTWWLVKNPMLEVQLALPNSKKTNQGENPRDGVCSRGVPFAVHDYRQQISDLKHSGWYVFK